MLEQNLKEYEDLGYTVVRGFFSKEELSQIENELVKFVETYKSQFKWDEINFTPSGEINSIHRMAGEGAPQGTFFSKLFESKKMTDLAKLFLKDEIEFRKMEFFAKPSKVGMRSPWHQDNFYWCINGGNALTVWLAMDQCGPENGGVEYIKGSHKWGLVSHKDSFAPGSSQTVADIALIEKNKDNIVCPKLQPGDVMIHHSQTIHGSDDNKSDRSRRGLTFQYKGLSATYNQEMKKHYTDRLNAQVAERVKTKG